MAGDLDFQQLSTVQNKLQPQPRTIASAATVAPTTLITFITGTTQIDNVTAPVTGSHVLVMIHTNAAPAAYGTGGNVVTAIAPVQNEPVLLVYDPISGNYYGGAVTG